MFSGNTFFHYIDYQAYVFSGHDGESLGFFFFSNLQTAFASLHLYNNTKSPTELTTTKKHASQQIRQLHLHLRHRRRLHILFAKILLHVPERPEPLGKIRGTAVLDAYNYSTNRVGEWVGIMVVIIAAYRVLGFAVLWIKKH
jgi:hypothetical protein